MSQLSKFLFTPLAALALTASFPASAQAGDPEASALPAAQVTPTPSQTEPVTEPATGGPRAA